MKLFTIAALLLSSLALTSHAQAKNLRTETLSFDLYKNQIEFFAGRVESVQVEHIRILNVPKTIVRTIDTDCEQMPSDISGSCIVTEDRSVEKVVQITVNYQTLLTASDESGLTSESINFPLSKFTSEQIEQIAKTDKLTMNPFKNGANYSRNRTLARSIVSVKAFNIKRTVQMEVYSSQCGSEDQNLNSNCKPIDYKAKQVEKTIYTFAI